MSEPTFAERYAAFARFNPEHVRRRLDTLARNLAIAGALCEAFQQGSDYRMRMMLALSADEDWKPGCRLESP